ncbi:hypothetical protein KIW84_045040 [Lathyrus oleraceus]|uniref:FAR1 domain-containing protein n=2 Tax=Pisum sativum TaxID=3888 RepID=A0A9D4XHJ0_PEA|nr:hypothetical protein KIW84_045040 [Pisum sativum]
MEFRTVSEYYNFYYSYGKYKGFAIRKGDVRRRGPEGSEIVVMRQYVYNNHGLRDNKHLVRVDRKRDHRCLTRTRCAPRLYVHYKDKKDRAQIDGLQSQGIITCHIMGYMVAQKGGYNDVGFTKKYLYNYSDKKKGVAIKDGDVGVTLNFLNVKSFANLMMYAEYCVNSERRLKSLFWADDTSRSYYFGFDDVVVFGTTSKIQLSVG